MDKIRFPIDPAVILSGDVLIKCFYKRTQTSSRETLFSIQFNSSAVQADKIYFYKQEMDVACSNAKFPNNGRVDLLFKENHGVVKDFEKAVSCGRLGVDRTQDPSVRWDSYEDFRSASFSHSGPASAASDHIDSGGRVHGPMQQQHSTRLGAIQHTAGPVDGSPYAEVVRDTTITTAGPRPLGTASAAGGGSTGTRHSSPGANQWQVSSHDSGFSSSTPGSSKPRSSLNAAPAAGGVHASGAPGPAGLSATDARELDRLLEELRVAGESAVTSVRRTQSSASHSGPPPPAINAPAASAGARFGSVTGVGVSAAPTSAPTLRSTALSAGGGHSDVRVTSAAVSETSTASGTQPAFRTSITRIHHELPAATTAATAVPASAAAPAAHRDLLGYESEPEGPSSYFRRAAAFGESPTERELRLLEELKTAREELLTLRRQQHSQQQLHQQQRRGPGPDEVFDINLRYSAVNDGYGPTGTRRRHHSQQQDGYYDEPRSGAGPQQQPRTSSAEHSPFAQTNGVHHHQHPPVAAVSVKRAPSLNAGASKVTTTVTSAAASTSKQPAPYPGPAVRTGDLAAGSTSSLGLHHHTMHHHHHPQPQPSPGRAPAHQSHDHFTHHAAAVTNGFIPSHNSLSSHHLHVHTAASGHQGPQGRRDDIPLQQTPADGHSHHHHHHHHHHPHHHHAGEPDRPQVRSASVEPQPFPLDHQLDFHRSHDIHTLYRSGNYDHPMDIADAGDTKLAELERSLQAASDKIYRDRFSYSAHRENTRAAQQQQQLQQQQQQQLQQQLQQQQQQQLQQQRQQQQLMAQTNLSLVAKKEERPGSEIYEEIETITLQPIGKGVQDLETSHPTLARTLSGGGRTAAVTQSMDRIHQMGGHQMWSGFSNNVDGGFHQQREDFQPRAKTPQPRSVGANYGTRRRHLSQEYMSSAGLVGPPALEITPPNDIGASFGYQHQSVSPGQKIPVQTVPVSVNSSAGVIGSLTGGGGYNYHVQSSPPQQHHQQQHTMSAQTQQIQVKQLQHQPQQHQAPVVQQQLHQQLQQQQQQLQQLQQQQQQLQQQQQQQLSAIHSSAATTGTLNHNQYHQPNQSLPGQAVGSVNTAWNTLDVTTSDGSMSTPKFVRDTSKFWYKPNITREQAINILRDKPPGSFVVRDSNSFPGAFGLAVKVAQMPQGVTPKTDDISAELVRHFLIEPTSKGVRLKGCSNEPVFGSLTALIYQHTLTALALPCRLVIPPGLDGQQTTVDGGTILRAPAIPGGSSEQWQVLYLGTVEVESMTGSNAVVRSIDTLLDEYHPGRQTTECQMKLSSDGVTLTDTQRKLFFRRHYQPTAISFCGIDPKGRSWSGPEVRNRGLQASRIFGLITRKQASQSSAATDNVCHVLCELQLGQSSVAIVNSLNRFLRR